MRPLFASLAFLLLALCSPWSVGAATFEEIKGEIEKLTPQAQTEALKSNSDGALKLMNLLEATVAAAGGDPQLHESEVKIFKNGVACALAAQGDVKTLMYGTGYDAARPKEEAFALKYLSEDCTNVDKDAFSKCFCKDKNPIVVCGAEKYKEKNMAGVTKTDCASEALTKLKTIAPSLAENYDYSKLKTDPNINAIAAILRDATDAIDQITLSGKPEMVKFFCDAVKVEVAPAMKTLLHSDYLVYKSEKNLVLKDEIRPSVMGLAKRCKEAGDTFKDSILGKCMCANDNFVSFCVYNALGKIFEQIGYVKDCDKTPTFDATKKPQKAEIGVEQSPATNGTTNGSTTLAPSTAPASFSLLGAATAAVAAAAMLA